MDDGYLASRNNVSGRAKYEIETMLKSVVSLEDSNFWQGAKDDERARKSRHWPTVSVDITTGVLHALAIRA